MEGESDLNSTVSIIIPCRNEELYIGQCIESFLNQSYPKELIKIVIADGMSTDETRKIIKSYQKENNNILLIDNHDLTAPTGMNKGIMATDSDIVIIFGAHAYADKDFVLENVNKLSDESIGCSGGPITTISDGVVGTAIANAMSCPFGVGNALFRFSDKEVYVDTVAFGAYRRTVLDRIGLFDEQLVRNQDDELNFRVVKDGKKILLSPKIKSTYYSRGSLRKLYKQYFQYGFWKVRVIQKHKRPASIRHLVPVIFVIYLILGLIMSMFSTTVRNIFLLILALYIMLDIVFARKCSKGEGIKCFMYNTAIFPILHFSYGAGFLLGIFNFYVRSLSGVEKKNKVMSR